MAWENRDRGGSYYYRKEREGSRVRSVYVGSGQRNAESGGMKRVGVCGISEN